VVVVVIVVDDSDLLGQTDRNPNTVRRRMVRTIRNDYGVDVIHVAAIFVVVMENVTVVDTPYMEEEEVAVVVVVVVVVVDNNDRRGDADDCDNDLYPQEEEGMDIGATVVHDAGSTDNDDDRVDQLMVDMIMLLILRNLLLADRDWYGSRRHRHHHLLLGSVGGSSRNVNDFVVMMVVKENK
jgi:hypothetical protein